jgi:hypothetical protein
MPKGIDLDAHKIYKLNPNINGNIGTPGTTYVVRQTPASDENREINEYADNFDSIGHTWHIKHPSGQYYEYQYAGTVEYGNPVPMLNGAAYNGSPRGMIFKLAPEQASSNSEEPSSNPARYRGACIPPTPTIRKLQNRKRRLRADEQAAQRLLQLVQEELAACDAELAAGDTQNS